MNDVVLVTGAGGFLGSAVVRRLVQALREGRLASGGVVSDHVVALLRPGGTAEGLEELPRTGDWSIQYADLTDRRALECVLDAVKPRAIVHTALDARTYQDLPELEQDRMNLAPLETLFEGLRDTPGARFVHTGSAWVLPAGDRLDETVAPQPRSPYAVCKARTEQCLPRLGDRTGVAWINLRLFNIFGKYEKPQRLLPYLVSKLTRGEEARLSHGNQTRDFTEVDDMAHAYLLALGVDEGACGRVYHIGSGHGMSVRDFAMSVADTTGNTHLIRFDAGVTTDQDVPCLVADPSLAERVLGWSPGRNVNSRIQQAVEWWRGRLDSAVIPRYSEGTK